MTALRTLVVGFGQVASGLSRDPRMAAHFEYASHASVLAAHPGFDWQGVVDPNAAALDDARTNWRVAHAGADLTAVADAVRPEIAVLAAPPGNRADMVEAMPDLKAVLVEKPLARPGDDGADCARLAAICAERGIPVLVNYWRRADRLFRDLATGGLAARIGRAQAVTGLYGNGVANNGGHLVDFLRMMLGEVAAVQALGPARLAHGAPLASDRHVAFALTFADGPVATVQPLDFTQYREVGLDIWGETGRLSILQEGLVTEVFPLAENRGLTGEKEVASDAGETLESTVSDAFYRMYDNLAGVAEGRAAPWSPLASALMNERILGLVLRSAAEGGSRLSLD
jgi:predicted dehydrogenase